MRKTGVSLPVFMVTVVFFILLPLQGQAKSSCAKVGAVSGSSCQDLKVELDLSACGDVATLPVKIGKCGDAKFFGEAKGADRNFLVRGSGEDWGSQVDWKVDLIKESDAPKRVAKEKPAKAPRLPAQLETQETPAPPPVPVANALPETKTPEKKFESTLVFNGDIRQRFEQVSSEAPAVGKEGTFNQWRLRARAGVKAQATQDVSLEFRLATGPGGIATNQTYGDTKKAFRNYDFLLDRASAQWSPLEGSALIVGRMANPYVSVGENDLIFDADLNIDGMSLVTEQKFGSFKLNARAGSYILSESKDTSNESDVTMNSLQVAGTWTVDTDLSFSLVAAIHQFDNVKNHGALLTGDFGGNSNASSLYTNDYHVSSVGGEVNANWIKPVTLYAEYVANSAISDERDGKILGVKFGKLKAAGDWAFAADYRELKKDAVFGVLTDGDSFGGGTDGRGFRASAGYAFSKAFNLVVTGFNGSKFIADTETSLKRDKFQVDLNFKF